MTSVRLVVASAALAGCLAAVAAPRRAGAYEFEIRARTIGQGYQVRWLAPEGDRLLNRRRLTQWLTLDLRDLLAPTVDPGFPDAPRERAPVDVFASVSLRLDHDFGSYVQGRVRYPLEGTMTVERPATEVVAELAAQDVGLDVLWASVGARDLFGFLDAELGRQVRVETLDWIAFDGLHVRARTPWPFAVEALGGLMVREASPFGRATLEPDGTSSARCAVFAGNDLVLDPAEECPQRGEPMPTLGVAVESAGLPRVSARASYRRSVSPTADETLPASRRDAAPAWGVNEEHAALAVRGRLRSGRVIPWIETRWNFLLAMVDEARAGVRLAFGNHAVTPQLVHSYPSFEGDSIFNVFSAQPHQDARLTVDLWPGRGPIRLAARGFVRQFHTDLGGRFARTIPRNVEAAGGAIGARWTDPTGSAARVDLYYEDGYGGLRAGADGGARWRATRAIDVEGRVTVLSWSDGTSTGEATSFGAQGGGLWRLGEGIALHLLGEGNVGRVQGVEGRLLVVLDLAFRPEHP